MISPLINSIVIAAFGFFIGSILQIAMIVNPEKSRDSITTSTGRRGWGGFVDYAKEAAEEGREHAQNAPGQFWVATFGFYGLIAILILVLIYSPLEMNWLIFLVALMAGFMLFDRIFQKAKAGKIPPASSSPDDSPHNGTET